MQPTTSEIKAASKQELQKLLGKFSHHVVRKEINEVIKDFRRCSLKEAGDVRILKPKEVEAVLIRFQ